MKVLQHLINHSSGPMNTLGKTNSGVTELSENQFMSEQVKDSPRIALIEGTKSRKSKIIWICTENSNPLV